MAERRSDQPTGIGCGNVISVAANISGQHGKTRGHGFDEDGSGVFPVGGMKKKIGAEEKSRNIVAPVEKVDMAVDAQAFCQAFKGTKIILADDHQVGALADLVRKGGKGPHGPIGSFGSKTGAHHEDQVILQRNVQIAAQLATDAFFVGRRDAIPGDAGRQDMEPTWF